MIFCNGTHISMEGTPMILAAELGAIASELREILVKENGEDYADFVLATVLTEVTMPSEEEEEVEITKDDVMEWLDKHLENID